MLNFSKTGQANSPFYSILTTMPRKTDQKKKTCADGTSMEPLALELVLGVGGFIGNSIKC